MNYRRYEKERKRFLREVIVVSIAFVAIVSLAAIYASVTCKPGQYQQSVEMENTNAD